MDEQNNFEELLKTLEKENEISEDRTIYLRDTLNGERVDFEIVEKTDFSNSYPATTKELRTKQALCCGHVVSKDNPFGGYCQGRNFFFSAICNNEHCEKCILICPRCGVSASKNCHVGQFDGVLYCLRCRRTLLVLRILRSLIGILIYPFISPDIENNIHHENRNDQQS